MLYPGDSVLNKTPLKKSARGIVAVCNAGKANETVLIVTDSEVEAGADLLAEAARPIGVDVNVAMMPPRKVDGQESTALLLQPCKQTASSCCRSKHLCPTATL